MAASFFYIVFDYPEDGFDLHIALDSHRLASFREQVGVRLLAKESQAEAEALVAIVFGSGAISK